MVDAVAGVIGIEWIEGKSVRHLLPGGAEEEVDEACIDEEDFEEEDPLLEYGISQGSVDHYLILEDVYSHVHHRDFDGVDWNRNR
jgi:TP53 regulating kinase-like protein